MQLPIRVAREGGFEPRKRSGLDAKIMSAKPRLVWHRPTERSIHLPSGARIDMSKERPPACKNLRSFQTAEKGDLESACPWGRLSEATCRLAPKRGHVRALHTVRGKARAKNYSLGQRT